MPEYLFLKLLASALLITFAVAVTFWPEIWDWTRETLVPWLNSTFPSLTNYITDAFISIDSIITPIRKRFKESYKNSIYPKIKEAWDKIRQVLLGVLIQFKEYVRNSWIKNMTWWVVDNKELKKMTTEEKIHPDSLPLEIRKEWFEKNNKTLETNVATLRDKEVDEYAMGN